jgi:EAL domain-containing protein (putative c-di-GMP-specific phosphodiesterase class I)/GGDEF domain-containing protein
MAPPAPDGRRPTSIDAMLAAAYVLDIAFQPIVNCRTGQVYGQEALLRGHAAIGFADPPAVITHAHELGCLPEVEAVLHQRAIRAFAALGQRDARVFLNLDGRSASAAGIAVLGPAMQEAERQGLPPHALCIELSEAHRGAMRGRFGAGLAALREKGLRVAADDFGSGFSEIRILFDGQTDYVKVDRFFVAGATGNKRKLFFLRQLVAFAHALGVRVIAEGVETAQDHLACLEAGADFVQGWFIERPQTDHSRLPAEYPAVVESVRAERRQRQNTLLQAGLVEALDITPPLPGSADIELAFNRFGADAALRAAPVVDGGGVPIGLVREGDLRPYVFSRYGRDLLRTRNTRARVQDFTTACPVLDASVPPERLMEAFLAAEEADGVILTRDGRFLGLLSANAILHAIQERRLRSAVEQNPLTHLPGNTAIAEWIESAGPDRMTNRILAYFDFDNFKPFNDHFGFRRGDLAIRRFADLLREHFAPMPGSFLGHVGGDDFFLGLRLADAHGQQAAHQAVAAVIEAFGTAMRGSHAPAEQAQGWFLGQDRTGATRRFPLLSCSVLVIEIAGGTVVEPELLPRLVAEHKPRAKRAPDGLALLRLGDAADETTADADAPASSCHAA